MAAQPRIPLFQCSWGDLRLFVSSCRWDNGRTQVVHDLSTGNVHPLQDRGLRARRTRLALMFDEFPGVKDTPLEAFRKFKVSVDLGERRLFTHPVDGSYYARVGDFDPDITDSSVMSATCEFIADDEVDSVSPVGILATGVSGEGNVLAASNQLEIDLFHAGIGFQQGAAKGIDFKKPPDLSFSKGIKAGFNYSPGVAVALDADIGVTAGLGLFAGASASAAASATVAATASARAAASANATAFASVYARAAASASAAASANIQAFAFAYASAALTTDITTSVSSWRDDGTPTRQVLVDVARNSESLSQMIEIGELESDHKLWPAYRSALLLGEAMRSAAISATSSTTSVFSMRVRDRQSLLALSATIYGGRAAQEKAREISLLNDIARPGWLDPGDYVMPARQRGRGGALR